MIRLLHWFFPHTDYERRRDEILIILAYAGDSFGLDIQRSLQRRRWYNPGALIYGILHRMEEDRLIEGWFVPNSDDPGGLQRRRYRICAPLEALPQRVRNELNFAWLR